jgi:Tfp pilus assembly protein PilF
MFFQNRELNEAMLSLSQAVARDPGQAACYEMLGRIFQEQSRNEEAQDMFRRAGESQPQGASSQRGAGSQ